MLLLGIELGVRGDPGRPARGLAADRPRQRPIGLRGLSRGRLHRHADGRVLGRLALRLSRARTAPPLPRQGRAGRRRRDAGRGADAGGDVRLPATRPISGLTPARGWARGTSGSSALPQLVLPYVYGQVSAHPRAPIWVRVGGYLSVTLLLFAALGALARDVAGSSHPARVGSARVRADVRRAGARPGARRAAGDVADPVLPLRHGRARAAGDSARRPRARRSRARARASAPARVGRGRALALVGVAALGARPIVRSHSDPVPRGRVLPRLDCLGTP